ncbi:MAG TPA: hypothetical protein VKR21_09600 [Solirubrobacteraceae bacterium]|nr:hypothetical protein [Solirubrobacteraceae bacterium]
MSGRSAVAAAVAASLFAAAPAVAQSQTDTKTVTATGTGQARVHPTNRHSNSSIAAAYDVARQAAIGSALAEAHQYALQYAQGVGLTLGNVLSVSDAQNNGFYGPGGPGGFPGPFGPNKFCGTLHQIVGRPTPGTRPTFKKVHRCIVPSFAFTTLTVTYSAS